MKTVDLKTWNSEKEYSEEQERLDNIQAMENAKQTTTIIGQQIAEKNERIKQERLQRDHDKKVDRLKNRIKFMVKLVGVPCAVGYGAIVLVRGANYVTTDMAGMLDFSEIDYYKNPNVEAGYYNKHPVSIKISDEFNERQKNVIEKAIKDFDKKAKGLSFTMTYGDTDHCNDDITINYDNDPNTSIMGRAFVGKLDAKKIKGSITLNTSNPTFLLKSVTQHELCHVIGLRHSKNPNDLMFPAIDRLTLSKKDIEKINTIYPAEDDSNTKNESVRAYYTIIPKELFNVETNISTSTTNDENCEF